MGTDSKREYLTAIHSRYRKASKKAKRAIRDEVCQVCGYHKRTELKASFQRRSS
jgi:hypothetical protein